MNTPIVDFVNEYNNKQITRMHMPGHKGAAFLGFERYDITEINGADSLYHADGIIASSERNASELFQSGRTVYSTEGSSICIKTMLYLALQRWKTRHHNGRPIVIAARNAHISFVHAAMLLDFDVRWLWPEDDITKDDYNILACRINMDKLNEMLNSENENVVAVYITSPDYLGNVSDIRSISKICKSHNTCLIVDNAHGAYLKFLSGNDKTNYIHPLDCGADMCCDSAHKTLPVLTGGAYLHISKDADSYYIDKVKLAMNIFGSTSPSYLILESLDKCNRYISEGYVDRLIKACSSIESAKISLRECGYDVLESDPLKITIRYNKAGNLSNYLRTNNIECEYSDEEYVVLMLTPENSQDDIDRLVNVLKGYKELDVTNIEKCCTDKIKHKSPISAMTIREAMMKASERVDIEDSLGRICSAPLVACPPAIPIVVSGEIIDEFAINTLKRYNIKVIECVIE